MRTNLFLLFFVFSTSVCLAQEQPKQVILTKDENSNIASVEFINADPDEIPKSAGDFFKGFLHVTPTDQFIKTHESIKDKHLINEHYDQYYNGIKVDEGGYNFHYINNVMFYAHGDYKKIDHLDISYKITSEDAVKIFAEHKNIPTDSIYNYSSDTLIKEIETGLKKECKLVYKITLFSGQVMTLLL